MFYIDSPTQRVDAFDVDPASGAISNRQTVVEIPATVGVPDGMTIDDMGCLWIALWGAGAVHRYTPDGLLDMIVELPCRQATSCAFGGRDLDELFITSSPYGLSDAEREAQPLAGGLFSCRPGMTGPAAIPFAG
jgi:sugar lactone lactonase YvrE